MPTSIILSGFKEFEAKLKALPKVLMNEVNGEVRYAAEGWAGLAKRDAPKDQGALAGNIDAVEIKKGEWEVVSHSDYSAYMEWGTKTRVRVPSELQAYASQFRGGNNQGGAKKMIFAWMERVGIPKERQWVTFISIIIKGVHPHPFFFIQRPIIEPKLISAVQTILNTEH